MVTILALIINHDVWIKSNTNLQQKNSTGLNPINKNLNSEKFWQKSENFEPTNFFRKSGKFSDKIFWCSCWTDFWKFSSEYFNRNTFWKSEEIFRILIIFLSTGLSPGVGRGWGWIGHSMTGRFCGAASKTIECYKFQM